MARIDEAYEQLSRLIQHIHGRIETESAFSPALLRKARMILGPLPLLDDEADQFSDVVTTIYELTTAKKEHIDFPATENLIQTAVVDSVDPLKRSGEHDFNLRLANAIAVLKAALSQGVRDWTIYHLVRGVAPQGLPFVMGNVEFSGVDGSLAAAVKSSKLANTVGLTEQGDIFGKVSVKAQEYSAANLLAMKKVRSAVDVVNFFLDVIGGAHQFIFLPGDRETARAVSFGLQESRLAYTSSTISGPLAPMYLGYINGELARRSGLERASLLLAKENRNGLEDRLLASIQWAGRAAVDERLDEAFLLFVIALESLLLKKDMLGELRFRFALYGSHLLVKTFNTRKRVFDDLVNAYDRRSQIVHSGSTKVAVTELWRIHTYVRDAILAVLLNPLFRDIDEDGFDSWLKNRAVGATEESA